MVTPLHELSQTPARFGDQVDPNPDPPKVPGPRLVDRSSTGQNGSWPRMLVLGDEIKGRLVTWVQEEIRRARLEKEPLIDDWRKWQNDYWARPEKAVKNFPFQRSANIVVPLTAIAVEAIYARLINTLFGVKPLWSIRPKSLAWVDAAQPVQNWLQTEVEDPTALNAYDFSCQSLLELCKLGTCIGKSGYEKLVKKSIKFYNNDEEQELFVTVKDGSTLDPVPIANFLSRIGERDVQRSSWCGEEHEFTWGQLKKMALSGQFDKQSVEAIRQFWVTARTNENNHPEETYKAEVDKLTHQEPLWHEVFHTQEIWCSFDVDNDGIDEEIVLDIHESSGVLLSARYNWYDDLHRPYRICNYIPVEGRIFGVGIGKQLEQLQREATTIHRQRLDNATLANMRMIAISKTSGYGPGEPIFPGKMWFLNDVSQIKELKLSEVYPSSFSNEQAVVGYADKRTGVNDVMLGVPQEGTPGTATGDLTRLAEGNKKFDFVLKNVRRWLGMIGGDVLANYQQFGDGQRHWLAQDENGQWVEKVLNMPQQLVLHGAVIELTVTDSTTNTTVEQQTWMALFKIITDYYRSVMELAGAIGDNKLFVQAAEMAVTSGDQAMKRLLETFKEPATERFLLTQQPGAENAAAELDRISATGPSPDGQPTGMAAMVAALGNRGAGVNGGSSSGPVPFGRQ
jgi:hypothetical protein